MNTHEIYNLVGKELGISVPLISSGGERTEINRDKLEINNIVFEAKRENFADWLCIYTLKPNGEKFKIYSGRKHWKFEPKLGAWCWPMFCAIHSLQEKERIGQESVENKKKQHEQEVHKWFMKENNKRND